MINASKKYKEFKGGSPHSILVNMLDCNIEVSSKCSHAFTFPFRLILLGKV